MEKLGISEKDPSVRKNDGTKCPVCGTKFDKKCPECPYCNWHPGKEAARMP